tara:strand:- start:176 stop:2128 length:1953 start_codon:yes stop_codon:yes gene_type:complete
VNKSNFDFADSFFANANKNNKEDKSTSNDEKNETDKKETKTMDTSSLKSKLRVMEVQDSSAMLSPRTPDGSPRKSSPSKSLPSTFQNKIFQPSSPRVGGKHQNKNMSLGAEEFNSSVPKIESGWMYKQGQLLKAKKKRWFELTPNQLIYRESQTHSAKRGHMQLQKCVVRCSETSLLDFQLISPERTLHLTSETPEDRMKWMSSITHNILLARRHVRTANVLALHHNAKQYNALDKIIRKRLEIVAHMTTKINKTDLNILAPSLFTVFSFRSLAMGCTLTSYCLAIEVERAESMATLFRSNSLGTKLLDLVIRAENDIRETSDVIHKDGLNHCDSLLDNVLPTVLTAIVSKCRPDNKYGLELDTERMKEHYNKHNWAKRRDDFFSNAKATASNQTDEETAMLQHIHADSMNEICSMCLDTIENALHSMLPLKCAVFVQLCDDMVHQFGRGTGSNITKTEIESYIVMLLFLRSINPSLMHPDAVTLYVDSNTPYNIQHVRRAQKTMAQVLQKLANGKRFEGPSNQYLEPMNTFIDANKNRLHGMYQIIEKRSTLMQTNPAKPPLTEEEAANIYDDTSIEHLYDSLMNIHTVMNHQTDTFTRMTTKQLSEFSVRSSLEPGFDPVSAFIDLEVVLESFTNSQGNNKWYGDVDK